MFLPDYIDLGNVQKYSLTIRVKSDGFSFLIQDIHKRDIYTYQETTFQENSSLLNNIQRIIFDLNFLTDNFSRVIVVVVSSNYELIPNLFFDEKSFANFYKFTHNSKTEHVLVSEQPLPECHSVFGLDNEVYLFLMRSLYAPVFYHHSSLLIDYFSSKINEDKKNSMFVNFHNDITDLICFNHSSVILHSHTFINENEADLSYYILNIWEKCKFDQLSDLLLIYGYPPGNGVETTLGKYIKEVKNIGLIDQLTDFGEKAQSVPLDVLNLL